MIDVQNYGVDPKGGAFAKLGERELDDANRFLNLVHAATLPNQARLLRACRDAGIEVIYTVIQNLTLDGRDRSLDYKISGIDVPKGSCDAKVPDIVAPLADEIVIPKTSSSVFISTNIDYLLRNLRIRSLVIAGFLYGPMRRFCSARRLRPRLSRDAGHRCMRHPHAGAPRGIAAQQSRLLPRLGRSRRRSSSPRSSDYWWAERNLRFRP